MRIVVGADHVPWRTGLRLMLEEHGFEVCAEAATAEEAVRAVEEEAPDLCLLDLELPGGGIAAAERIAASTHVVLLTAAEAEADLFDALRAGASGYLAKETGAAELSDSLRRIAAGEGALSGAMVARLMEEFRQRGRRSRLPALRSRGIELTDREWEVLELLRADLSTKQIAGRLGISEITVRRHVGAIVGKLGVRDRSAAVRFLAEATRAQPERSRP